MKTNLSHLVALQARQRPATPALTYKDATLSYGELDARVSTVATGLRRLGLSRGERVGIYLDKRLETVEAIFGTARAGAVFAPINPLLRPPQVAYILADCDVRLLVTTSERLEQLRPELGAAPKLEMIVLAGAEGAESRLGSLRVIPWSVFIDREPAIPAAPEPPRVDADVAAIFYTSGSTGKPKGVVLSHRNLIVGGESVSHSLGNTADDIILSLLPLSFDAGFSQLTTAFNVGAHVVLHNYLLPDDAIRLCAKHRVTGLTGVPPLWLQLADRPWPLEASRHVRYFANTGGRMPKPTLDRLRRLAARIPGLLARMVPEGPAPAPGAAPPAQETARPQRLYRHWLIDLGHDRAYRPDRRGRRGFGLQRGLLRRARPSLPRPTQTNHPGPRHPPAHR